MKTMLLLIAATLVCLPVAAQDLGSFEEVTAGNYFGLGARQMSMGGTGIASSLDGAALYYNPAALARIYRIEFQLGLTHQKFSNTTTQAPGRYEGFTSIVNSASGHQTKTRLGTVNLTVPVPTYRGSLVVSFGANRIMSFDRIARYNVVDRNDSGLDVFDQTKEFETGNVYLYAAGAGIDISPNVSLGLALNVYSGKDKFVFDYYYRDETQPEVYEESLTRRITEDYIGATLKGGLLARPSANLAVGLTMETPMDWQVEQTYAEGDYGDVVEYDLTRPFIFGAGVAVSHRELTLAGDIEYADWSQMSYGDNPDMELGNDSLSQLYRETVNLRLGAEYQFPKIGLGVRAGWFSQPLPYDSRFIDDDRTGYTLGAGWLIDRVLMLEAAYVHGGFTRLYTAANGYVASAKDSYSQLFVTLSYRY